jgi:hypothetical protein
MKTGDCRGPVSRRKCCSPAAHRVVHVFTGLLSQFLQGEKWRERATRETDSPPRAPKQADHLAHCGSSHIASITGCGGHQAVASSRTRGRLHCRGSHQGPGPSLENNPSRTLEKLWAGPEIVNQGCNSGFVRVNGAAHLATRHRTSWCYSH